MNEPREREPLIITSEMLDPAPRTTTHDPRINFERGMSYAPRLTLTVMIGLVAVFWWELARGALTDRESLIAAGALIRDRTVAGEWWRIGTATFLHGGVDHLIGNLISFYILGMACEHALGAAGLAGVYAISGSAGSLLSLALSPGPSVGASGAIFGLMGALVVILVRNHKTLYLRDKRVAVVIVAWAGYTLLLGLMTPFVDNGAHLGGLIGGLAAAHFFPLRLGR